MERTNLEHKNWNSLVGKTYYSRCPDDERYFRSIYVRHNPFTNSLQPMISNPIAGEPPAELEEIPPLMLNRLMRLQMTSHFF